MLPGTSVHYLWEMEGGHRGSLGKTERERGRKGGTGHRKGGSEVSNSQTMEVDHA